MNNIKKKLSVSVDTGVQGDTGFQSDTGVCWNGSKFVAVGQGTNTIAYSYDGITWTGSGIGPVFIDNQLIIDNNELVINPDNYYDQSYNKMSVSFYI